MTICKSKYYIQHIIMCILICCIIFSNSIVLISCQATPSDNIVQTQKGSMMEIISNENENNNLNIPEHYRDEINSKNEIVSIVIDAEVCADSVDHYPVYSIEPIDISDEFANDVIKTLINDKTLYSYPAFTGEWSCGKDFYGEAISILQEQLSSSSISDSDKESIRNRISNYKDKYRDAPETIFEIPANTSFSPLFAIEGLQTLENDWENGLIESIDEYKRIKALYLDAINNNDGYNMTISGIVDLEDSYHGYLTINKTTDDGNNYVEYQVMNTTDYIRYSIGAIDNKNNSPLSITKESALEMADELLNRIGANYMALANSIITKYIAGDEYYLFTYFRSLNKTKGEAIYSENDNKNSYSPSLQQETISIGISDYGVIYFKWITPSNLVEIYNESVNLLGFDDIMDIFKQQMIVKSVYLGDDSEYIVNSKFYINKVILSTFTVRNPNSSNEYISIPVWDFQGYQVLTYSESYEEYVSLYGGYQLDQNNCRIIELPNSSYLTINAIDGSIIDRSKGY